jgi:hypothetical protein
MSGAGSAVDPNPTPVESWRHVPMMSRDRLGAALFAPMCFGVESP